MQKFHMSARSIEVKHFNTRTESHGDDSALRGDLKIKAIGNLDDLDNWLLGDKSLPSKVFYNKDGNRRILGIKPLKTDREIEGLTVKITSLDRVELELEAVSINGLEIELQDAGTIELVCALRLNPTAHMEQIGNLLVDGRAEIEITAGQDEMDL